MFALKEGEISKVFRIDKEYHVVKLLGRKPKTVMAFDSVKEQIRQKLLYERGQKKVNEFLDQREKALNVKYNAEPLHKMTIKEQSER